MGSAIAFFKIVLHEIDNLGLKSKMPYHTPVFLPPGQGAQSDHEDQHSECYFSAS